MRVFFIVIVVMSLSVAVLGVDRVTQSESDPAMNKTDFPADSALAQADSVFQTRDYKAALTEYEAVVTLAQKQFNRSVETEALSQVARMNMLLNSMEKANETLKLAEQKADDADPQGWSRYLGVRGRYEWHDGDLAKARKTFEEMYYYCKANALYNRGVDAAHMVAIVADNLEDQVEWGKIGIEAAEKTENERWLGPLWNNMAGAYYDHKDWANALDCYLKAREYHWEYSDEIAKLYADYHVGMAYRLNGQYDEAGKWLRPVLAWADRLKLHSAIGQACEDLGEIEAAKGNKSEALAYFKRARDEYQAEGFDSSWKEIWDNINARIAAVQ